MLGMVVAVWNASPAMGDNKVSDATVKCRRVAVANWEAVGLKPRTIRARLSKFEAVGGAEATLESILAQFAHLNTASSRQSWRTDLRCTFRLLVAAGVLEHDPTVLLPRMRAPRWNPKPLAVDEVRRVLDGTTGDMHDWVTLALWAGLRAAEIAELRAEQLEMWPGGWVLRVLGKGDTDAVIPAHPRVVEVMLGRQGRLWPDTSPAMVSQYTRMRFRALGIEGGIHRCRHTFATRAMTASGNDLLVVRDLLRHSSVVTTQYYTKLADDRLFEVMEKIA